MSSGTQLSVAELEALTSGSNAVRIFRACLAECYWMDIDNEVCELLREVALRVVMGVVVRLPVYSDFNGGWVDGSTHSDIRGSAVSVRFYYSTSNANAYNRDSVELIVCADGVFVKDLQSLLGRYELFFPFLCLDFDGVVEVICDVVRSGGSGGRV